MNFLPMDFLRSLLADLRERQILPAVVLLVVLAIGIPIGASAALSSSAAPPPVHIAPVTLTPPPGVLPPAQAIAVTQATPKQKSVVYKGTELDPFRAPVASSSSAASTSSTPAKSTTTTGTTVTPPSTTEPKSTAPAKSTAPSTPTTGPAKLTDKAAYAVDVETSYGSQEDDLIDLQRLTPLPANSPAEVVYLGVLKGGKKAAFLLTGAVPGTLKKSSGVTCLPSKADCQIAELDPGAQIEIVPAHGQSSVSSFTLELGDIGDETYHSAGDATNARANVSDSGKQILATSTSTELGKFFYDMGLGALVYSAPGGGSTTGVTGSSGSTGASGASGSSGSSGATGTTTF